MWSVLLTSCLTPVTCLYCCCIFIQQTSVCINPPLDGLVYLMCLPACVHTQEESVDWKWSQRKWESCVCTHAWYGIRSTNMYWLFPFFPLFLNLLIFHLHPSIFFFPSCNIGFLPSRLFFRLSFYKSVSKQQVQSPSPKPSSGTPLVPAATQSDPTGTSQQVGKWRGNKFKSIYYKLPTEKAFFSPSNVVSCSVI